MARPKKDPAGKVFDFAINILQELRIIRKIPEFTEACELIASRRVWTTGMGKAGLISHKLASTLCSNGVPAAYIHAGEALHGDFGAIQRKDVVVAFSNSGATSEVIQVAAKVKERRGAKLILITGDHESEIAKKADIVLGYGKIKEACPLGLTPTTSIVAMLVIADALAMQVQSMRKLTYKQYAIYHHNGYLGQISREKAK
jgi:arabinose-5-phosphate isomerase